MRNQSDVLSFACVAEALMPFIRQLPIVFSVCLVSFLTYGSQWLFHRIEPGPLDLRQSLLFNVNVICVWISYFRSCFVHPGKLPSRSEQFCGSEGVGYCHKCKAYKPPRSHHCRLCARCIPKMDHHCPWTANCVSYRTFPHFIRFLFYGVLSGSFLQYLLFIRCYVLWEKRAMPGYLGPSPAHLSLLVVLLLTNSLNLFIISILFIRAMWSLCTNTTTIEGWEIERHEHLAHRAKKNHGILYGYNGVKIRFVRHEFPYDVGFVTNICQGMVNHPLLWLVPFAPSSSLWSSSTFERNGFSDLPWPPLDPDKPLPDFFMPEQQLSSELPNAADRKSSSAIRHVGAKSRNRWRNVDKETLEDYGVDEDMPLSMLQAGLKQKKN